MTSIEIQTMGFGPVSGSDSLDRSGVLRFATPAPVYTPPLTTRPSTGKPKPETHGHRTAIVGAVGVALVLAALGGIAYVRTQQVTSTTTTVAESVVGAHPAPVALDAQLAASAVGAHSTPVALDAQLAESTSVVGAHSTPVALDAQLAASLSPLGAHSTPVALDAELAQSAVGANSSPAALDAQLAESTAVVVPHAAQAALEAGLS